MIQNVVESSPFSREFPSWCRAKQPCDPKRSQVQSIFRGISFHGVGQSSLVIQNVVKFSPFSREFPSWFRAKQPCDPKRSQVQSIFRGISLHGFGQSSLVIQNVVKFSPFSREFPSWCRAKQPCDPKRSRVHSIFTGISFMVSGKAACDPKRRQVQSIFHGNFSSWFRAKQPCDPKRCQVHSIFTGISFHGVGQSSLVIQNVVKFSPLSREFPFMVSGKAALWSSRKVDFAHLALVDTLQCLLVDLIAQHTVVFNRGMPHAVHICSRSGGWRVRSQQAVPSFWWWFVFVNVCQLTNQLRLKPIVGVSLPQSVDVILVVVQLEQCSSCMSYGRHSLRQHRPCQQKLTSRTCMSCAVTGKSRQAGQTCQHHP